MMSSYYIGLMSGTSMDGVDAVLIETKGTDFIAAHQHHSIPYPHTLRQALLALQIPSENELHKASLLGIELAQLYAETVKGLLQKSQLSAQAIRAIGCHGQTIRHAPKSGYSIQIVQLPLLAKLTNIDVVGDFRSADIARGGQGAPLIPAFHQAVFSSASENRVLLNIGGIANISILPANQPIQYGFDTGPGNMLADAYMQAYFQQNYDNNGELAASGQCLPQLLHQLSHHAYFQQTPPKSTGRELFSLSWLEQYLQPSDQAADIMHTLADFTANTICDAIVEYAPNTQAVYVFGGGALNPLLVNKIHTHLNQHYISLFNTEELHIPPLWMEAAAFAWLAACRIERQAAAPYQATGASSAAILGAWYCA